MSDPAITAGSLILGFWSCFNRWTVLGAIGTGLLNLIIMLPEGARRFEETMRNLEPSHRDTGDPFADFFRHLGDACASCVLMLFLPLLLLLVVLEVLAISLLPILVVLVALASIMAAFPILAKLQRFDLQNAIAVCLPVPNGDTVPLSWYVLPVYLMLIALGAKKAIIVNPFKGWSFMDLVTNGAMPVYTNIMTVVSLTNAVSVLTLLWVLVTLAGVGVLIAAGRLMAMEQGALGCEGGERVLKYRYARLLLAKLVLHDVPQALLTISGLLIGGMPDVNQYMIYGVVTNNLSCVASARSLLNTTDERGRILAKVALQATAGNKGLKQQLLELDDDEEMKRTKEAVMEQEKRAKEAANHFLEMDRTQGMEHLQEWIQRRNINEVGAKLQIDAQSLGFEFPMHLAVREGDGSIARWLRQAGADPFARNSDGQTALQVAQTLNTNGSHSKCIEDMCLDEEIIRMFGVGGGLLADPPSQSFMDLDIEKAELGLQFQKVQLERAQRGQTFITETERRVLAQIQQRKATNMNFKCACGPEYCDTLDQRKARCRHCNKYFCKKHFAASGVTKNGLLMLAKPLSKVGGLKTCEAMETVSRECHTCITGLTTEKTKNGNGGNPAFVFSAK